MEPIKININDVFITEYNNYLKAVKIKKNGLVVMQLLDNNGNTIPEERNSFGHVIVRSNPQYTLETISSFKKLNKWEQTKK
jgi:hypothetical protein